MGDFIMNEKISVCKKKMFIKWLTKNYNFKVRESLWILDYLYDYEVILERTHFVEKVHCTPRGIYMSTSNFDKVGFIFYKNGHTYKDPMQSFHEIRLNKNLDLYFEIALENAWQSPKYLSVLEDNPHASWNDSVPHKVIKKMEKVLNDLTIVQVRKRLLKQIDESLLLKDKKKFKKLSLQFEKIDQLMNKCLLEN